MDSNLFHSSLLPSTKRTRPRPIAFSSNKHKASVSNSATSSTFGGRMERKPNKLFPVVSIGNLVLISSLIVFFNIIVPSPVEGLAVVRRNVVKIPHDVHPGYAIKRFGFGANTEHSYHLMPNDYSSYFTVLDNGLLMSTANMTDLIDHPVSLIVREEIPESNISTTHNVQLYVLDRRTMLSFPQEVYEGHVLENAPVGTHWNPCAPRLTQPGNSNMRLLELDRETQKIYSLIVKAYDLVGVDSATTKLSIVIDDENDNGPVFTKNLYRWPFPQIPVDFGEILLVNKPEDQSYQLEVQAHDVRQPSLFSNQPATVIIEVGSPEIYEASCNTRRETTMRKEFLESEGQPRRLVFELTKEVEYETFKIRDENPWVTVEGNGGVRVKKKWDYEELGPEKTIDFWVTITNPGTAT
ncbi:Neural-cadherin, partial [Orchesella cincta]